jgi:hypothetical protein
MKVLELGKTSLCLGLFKGFWAVVCESLPVNFKQCRHRTYLTRIDRLTFSLEDVEHLNGMAPPSNPTKFTELSDEAVSHPRRSQLHIIDAARLLN